MRAKWKRKMNLVAWKPTWYKSLKNYCKASYLFDADWVMVVFWSVQPGKVCIYVAINRHLTWMADDQPLAFPVFDITLKIITYTKKFFLMWVLRVVGEYCVLVNRKLCIWAWVTCNIHQSSDTWWIFSLVLVMSLILHCICSLRILYSCL